MPPYGGGTGAPGHGPGRGRRTPHFLFFWRRKRENGPCTVQKRKRRLYLAGMPGFDRRARYKFDAWTQGLCRWSRASHYLEPSGEEISSTASGRTVVFPARNGPGAKRGKRRKSLRPTIRFPAHPSIEAKRSREAKRLFSFGPCTARFLFSTRGEKKMGGASAPAPARGREFPVPPPWGENPRLRPRRVSPSRPRGAKLPSPARGGKHPRPPARGGDLTNRPEFGIIPLSVFTKESKRL